MNPEAMQALMDVLAVTPEAPAADADPSDVVAAAQVFTEEREAKVEKLRALMGANPTIRGEAASVLQTINDRNAHWQAAMLRAKHELLQRVAAARQIRKRTPSSSAP